MAIDRDRAFEDDDGFIPGEGAPHFVGGVDLPATAIPSPTGPTVYLRANGEIWYSPTGGPWVRRFLHGRFDGGNSDDVYLPIQKVDGGSA